MAPARFPRTRVWFFTAIALAAASGVRSETLAEVYALARQGDPKYLAARHEFEAMSLSIDEARAGLFPTLNYEASRTETEQNILSSDNPVFSSGRSSFPTTNQSLILSQPLFKVSAWRRYQQSKATVKQAAATLADAEQDLVLRVATAYLGVLAAQDALGFAKTERESLKRSFDLVDTRFKNGLVTVVTLHDARARLAVKESDIVTAQNDLEDKRQALKELTGRDIQYVVPMPGEIPMPPPQPAVMEEWVAAALTNNPAVEARVQAVDVARQEIERQKAARYPVVDFTANVNRRKTGGSLFGGGSDVRTNEYTLRLTVPLFDGFLTSTVTEQAAKRYLGRQDELELQRRQLERLTRAAYQGVMSGVARGEALRQSIVSLESARTLKDEGYKAGLGTVLALLDAERDLYAAKRDAAQARYEFLLNTLRLKQAVGTLTENDLISISSSMK